MLKHKENTIEKLLRATFFGGVVFVKPALCGCYWGFLGKMKGERRSLKFCDHQKYACPGIPMVLLC